MSAMTAIIGYMSFAGLNLFAWLFICELLDEAGKSFENWVSRDMSNHKSLNNFLNKDGV